MGNLALQNVAGAVQVSNTGNLNVPAAGIDGVVGVSCGLGTVLLATTGSLTVPTGASIAASGGVTLDVGTGNAGSSSLIQGSVSGPSVTVNGGGGTNALTIDFTGGASLPNGFSINGGVQRQGRPDRQRRQRLRRPHLHAQRLQRGARPTTISISNLAAVTAAGGNLSDTFNVTPSATTTFNVNGGLPNPPASPGDTLNITLKNATTPNLTGTFSRTSGYSGGWTFGNRKAVNFSGVESLLPAVVQTVVLRTSGELDLFSPLTGGLQVLSAAGTVLSASSVREANGSTDVFLITSGAAGAAVPKHPVGVQGRHGSLVAAVQRAVSADQRGDEFGGPGRRLRGADKRGVV